MATLRGEPVDRPAVNFYEIGGFIVDPDDPDEFNIYNAPSWRPLLRLAEEHTDLIRMCSPLLSPAPDNPRDEFFHTATTVENGSRFTRTALRVAGREMTALTRRDPQVDTVWTLEHLLKDVDDLKAYLQLPDAVFDYTADVANLRAVEHDVGAAGILMVDTPDPLCEAAQLFSMADYMVLAMTEGQLFRRLLDRLARPLWERTAAVAAALPGRLWRIYGPEYATQPFLPPHLFDQYVVSYTSPMVEQIQAGGGFARIHCHGRLADILPLIGKMNPAALDPIEPPPAGDVRLTEVRRDYGRQMALFGNLEIRDIEAMPPEAFEKVVGAALAEGTAGQGRGFVLMPSASPYGRTISPVAMANYETMVRLATTFGG